MIDRLTLGADAAAAQPVDDLLQRQLVAQGRIEDHALLGQHVVQGLGLGHRAGEPVEQESAPAAEASRPFLDHLDDQAVGHELAPPHGVQGGLQRRAWLGLALGGPEDVTRGEVTHPERSLINSACVPLPTPGGPSKMSRYGRSTSVGVKSQRASPPWNQPARSRGLSIIILASLK